MTALTLTPAAHGAPSLLDTRAADLDARYRAARPGPLPTGATRGTALAATGSRAGHLFARFTRAVAWQGKVFTADGTSLVNSLSPLRCHAIRAQVSIGPSRLDGRDCIVIDYSSTSRVARFVRDEIREVEPGCYLGLVYVGRRRLPLRFALELTSPA